MHRCFLILGVCGLVWGPMVRGADWEALGDGVKDCAEALEGALAKEGGVTLPRGVYRLTRTVTIDLEKGGFAALSGDGTARLVMEGEGPALHFRGTHDGTASPATVKDRVWERERTPSVTGIEIVGGNEAADGIEATGTMQLTLDRVVVRGCRHAVHLTERNRNVLIANCHFYHNRGIGVFYDNVNLHQSNIVGCHISYNGGGGVVSRGGNVRNLHIGTCDIEGNHAEEGEATANVLIDCTGGSTGEVAITGCTIQHSRNAPDSANIRVLGRGFDEGVGKRIGVAETMEGHVTITGNVMSDVQVNLHLVGARGVTVAGNTLWQGMMQDVLVEDCRSVVMTGNSMDRNPRYVVNETKDTERNGVVFRNCEGCIFADNAVSGVRGQEAAVDFVGCRRTQVRGNTVLDSPGVLLRIKDCRRCLISDNLLDAGKEEAKGLEVLGGTDNQMGSNWVPPKDR
ncbi:MAG: right-handed parallel beta-helix repeat-containing protein [Verrucomicrobiales bacterium]|nr:right-handed parallel beta-helix repeat-containing protein [Verrucomicrobiales bacterium]